MSLKCAVSKSILSIEETVDFICKFLSKDQMEKLSAKNLRTNEKIGFRDLLISRYRDYYSKYDLKDLENILSSRLSDLNNLEDFEIFFTSSQKPNRCLEWFNKNQGFLGLIVGLLGIVSAVLIAIFK